MDDHTTHFLQLYTFNSKKKNTVSLPFSCSKSPFSAVQNGSEPETFALWEEPYRQARKWKPCAAKHSLADEGNTLQIPTATPQQGQTWL